MQLGVIGLGVSISRCCYINPERVAVLDATGTCKSRVSRASGSKSGVKIIILQKGLTVLPPPADTGTRRPCPYPRLHEPFPRLTSPSVFLSRSLVLFTRHARVRSGPIPHRNNAWGAFPARVERSFHALLTQTREQ